MPADHDLIAEGQAKLAASELFPLMHRDLGRIVELQLTGEHRDANAALIIWWLNYGAETLRRWESDGRDLRAHAVVLDSIMVELGITGGDDEAILPRIQRLKAELEAAHTSAQDIARSNSHALDSANARIAELEAAKQKAEWEAYSTAEVGAGRCPHSGLGLGETELVDGSKALMCGVCDCFGYPLAEAQRHPLGYVVVFDDPRTGPELQYDLCRLITNRHHAQEAYENLRYNNSEQADAYHLAEVREVQP